MIQIKKPDQMGYFDHGWLKTLHHFSFADYFDRDNMHFGVLRVVNDDLIEPGIGFPTHPHNDMEIISYVVDGELSHKDSMQNASTIGRGEVQYMSAGTGVFHSEENFGSEWTRLLQIWVLPDAKGHTPNYGDFRFDWNERVNKWLHMVSSKTGNAPIKVNQDVNFNVTYLEAGKTIDFEVAQNRQAYVVQIEGHSIINGQRVEETWALESVEENLHIEADDNNSHVLVIEMAKYEG
ncbi:pirin family protein [Culicoidibacter larvae]|uniref:Pirin family protein n=1 Tax=Culicoidibacter larvae TaxID=2579976 RepID=A0A5R8QFD4_9FIRM|nr:pirin-like bicupin family protein [Culicoidibacter larvae]TLG75369.1 pirin family protein [Culicoidibacter larvae]